MYRKFSLLNLDMDKKHKKKRSKEFNYFFISLKPSWRKSNTLRENWVSSHSETASIHKGLVSIKAKAKSKQTYFKRLYIQAIQTSLWQALERRNRSSWRRSQCSSRLSEGKETQCSWPSEAFTTVTGHVPLFTT